MPRAYLMSWEGSPFFRWVKMHKGTRYRVGCHELPITRDQWTKEASAPAANQWWESKLAHIQVAALELHPHAERLQELAERKDYALRHGHDADVIEAEIVRVQLAPATGDVPEIGPDVRARLELAQMGGVVIPPDTDPTLLATVFGVDDALHADRTRRERAVPADRTVGALFARWIADRQQEARDGSRSPESAAALETHLGKFVAFCGPTCPAESINSDLWDRFFRHCAAMVAKRDTAGKRERGDDGKQRHWAADTAGKVFTIARSFVKWLWELEILPALPRNLTDKRHKFLKEDKEPSVFRTREVHSLLSGANGVHKLILLLSLNCGMYARDIADLRKDQIDWKNGRITRRRSKMRKQKGALVVSYKLWPETLELLQAHLNTDDNEPRALTTKGGRPWVWSETLPSGKIKRADNVATIFTNIKKRVGMNGPDKGFKTFRKTSASRLNRNERYRPLKFLFLSHKPREVADKHYAKEGRKALDRAIRWLRKTYKLEELAGN